MTKKLKTKIKRSIIAFAGIATISAIGLAFASSKTGFFGMHMKDVLNPGQSDTIAINGEEKNVSGINSAKETEVADDGAIVCDSIMQGVKDNDLPDGTYTFRVTNGQYKDLETGEVKTQSIDYKVELINYKNDVIYSLADGETAKTIELGDTSAEYKMLVVKYHKNLTIDKGVTLTASTAIAENGEDTNLTYKKGMYLCVMGELTNNGEISMTARGTYNQEGENVYLWKNIDNTYEYVPAVGGAGGEKLLATKNQYREGNPGADGNLRATGGGGSGGTNSGDGTPRCYSGSGSSGTSYSGGSGGGGADGNFYDGDIRGEDAAINRRKRWRCYII